MKKFTILLAVAASAFTLAGCGDEPAPKPVTELVKNVSGGTADEQEAIQQTVKKSIAQISNKTTILVGGSYDLLEDSGDFLSLSLVNNTKVTSGKKYNVSIEWDVGETSLISSVTNPDASHKMVEFNYPGKTGEDTTYTFSIKSMTCGGASTTDPQVSYTLGVKKASYFHKDVKIADLNKLKSLGDGKYGYDLVDYETKPENAYYAPNPENADMTDKQYFYVNCVGKVIYSSPDGNWGLIADGDQIMEIYAGSALDILPSRYPAMEGKYVKVVGNMSQYMGNVQIGFITEMKKASASDVTEPTLNFAPTSAQDVAYISREDGTHLQCVNGANLSNSLRSFTGTYVPGSLKDKDGKAATKDSIPNNRFTFELNIGKVGDKDIHVTVAYDYHVDRDGKLGIYDKVKSFIDSTNPMTVKGTLRFCGSDSAPFNQVGGAWQIIPFALDHIA